MESGKFRSDLFYRVSTLPLNLPPLRQRREDILDLIEEFKSALHLTFVLTEDAKNILLRYAWPGNIRELRNCVEYMGCQNLPVIEPENLPFMIRTTAAAASHQAASAPQLETELMRLLSLEPQGRSQLSRLLQQEGFSVSEGRPAAGTGGTERKGLHHLRRGARRLTAHRTGAAGIRKQAEIGRILFQPVFSVQSLPVWSDFQAFSASRLLACVLLYIQA